MSETVKLIKRNGEEKTEYKHEVEEITIFQLAKSLNILKDIVGLARENQSIAELIDMGLASMEDTEEGKKQRERFVSDPLEAFQILLTEVPDKTIALLSAMSGIDRKVLEQQKAVVFFDVYNAIVEANDMMELIERGKKSLDVTRNKFNMKKFVKEKAKV